MTARTEGEATMRFRIQDNVLFPCLSKEARDDAPTSEGTLLSSDLLEKIKDADEPGWWFVRVVSPDGGEPLEGFIRSIQLTEAEPRPQTEAEPIDEKRFFRQIAYVSVRLCANRDYLFAVAFAAGGLENTAIAELSAIGPFRFLPETWKDLVEHNGEENDLTEKEITDRGSQAVFAAIVSVDAQTKLNTSLGRTPTIAQLYFAHLFGIEA